MSYVLGYLQSLLNRGLECNSIGVHRSAISKYHVPVEGDPVGEHAQIVTFMKGAFILNPYKKVLVPAWDLMVVLEVLKRPPFEPLSEISIKMLTLKTVFLLEITSARRCCEMQALGRVELFVRFTMYSVSFRTLIGFLSKTARLDHNGEEIVLPTFCKYGKELCVVRCLKNYIAVNKSVC